MKMIFHYFFSVAFSVVSVTILCSTYEITSASVESFEYDDSTGAESPIEPVEYSRLAATPMDVSSRLPKCKKGCYRRITVGNCKCKPSKMSSPALNDYYDDIQHKAIVSSFEMPQTQITTSPVPLSSVPESRKDGENTLWSEIAVSSSISSTEAIIDDSLSGKLSADPADAEKSVASVNTNVVCLTLITLFVAMLIK